MSDRAGLQHEFAVFARYLGASGNVSAIGASYIAMHGSVHAVGTTRWDERLVRFARGGIIATALADAYARLTTPRGLLRRKLVLVLALLESASSTHAQFDSARPASRPAVLLALVTILSIGVIRVVCSILVLGPLHALSYLALDRTGHV